MTCKMMWTSVAAVVISYLSFLLCSCCNALPLLPRMSSGYPNLWAYRKRKNTTHEETRTHTRTQKRSICRLWNEKLGLICNCQNESFVKFLWKFCEDFYGSLWKVFVWRQFCASYPAAAAAVGAKASLPTTTNNCFISTHHTNQILVCDNRNKTGFCN